VEHPLRVLGLHRWPRQFTTDRRPQAMLGALEDKENYPGGAGPSPEMLAALYSANMQKRNRLTRTRQDWAITPRLKAGDNLAEETRRAAQIGRTAGKPFFRFAG